MRAPNTWAPDARHPSFDSLPSTGTDQKFVDGRLMGREEYDVCDYRTDGTYTVDGRAIQMWRANLTGLQRYGRLRQERRDENRSSWQARRDFEDAYSEEVNSMIEEATK